MKTQKAIILDENFAHAKENGPSKKFASTKPKRGLREITNAVVQQTDQSKPTKDAGLKKTNDLDKPKRKPLGNIKNVPQNLTFKQKKAEPPVEQLSENKKQQEIKIPSAEASSLGPELAPPVVSNSSANNNDTEPVERLAMTFQNDDDVPEWLWPSHQRAERCPASFFDRLFSCYRNSSSPDPQPQLIEESLDHLNLDLDELLKELEKTLEK